MTVDTRSRIDALIFDCDGTLVDSEPLGVAALLHEAAAFGCTLNDADALAAFKGKRMADCVALLAAHCPQTLPPDFIDRVRIRTAALFTAHLTPMPGARALLAGLTLPYCLASNGPAEKIALSLQLCGLADVFTGPIFSAYDIGHWKPAPHLFLHAARALGVAPQHCAVVEDSAPGIAAGLAAGMTVFALGAQEHAAPPPDSRVIPIGELADLPPVLIAAPRTPLLPHYPSGDCPHVYA